MINSPRRIVQAGSEVAAVEKNTEVARFNMIHRPIRGWNVLDPGVLAALNEDAFSGKNLLEPQAAALVNAPRPSKFVF
jgi:hypothetical protein